MKRTIYLAAVLPLAAAVWLMAQPSGGETNGFSTVEVASVSDAMEQLYGQRAYMSHEMRPLSAAKFAGPAVTVMLKKEEHKQGAAASQGMLDAIDAAKPGSVYVMVLENGADYAGIGGLMATAMKYRGLAGAVIGVAIVPPARAADVLKKAQALDNTEHSMLPFIEKYRSIKEAVAKFGRI
jgi:4-hydroxy-4-methyl-2-oxoglutarate aldolase